jgi:hypothetical protein
MREKKVVKRPQKWRGKGDKNEGENEVENMAKGQIYSNAIPSGAIKKIHARPPCGLCALFNQSNVWKFHENGGGEKVVGAKNGILNAFRYWRPYSKLGDTQQK